MKFARKQHPTVYNRVDLCVTIHKPILLGCLVLFNDKNKNYEKIRKNTNAPLNFGIRIFLSWTPPQKIHFCVISCQDSSIFFGVLYFIDLKFPFHISHSHVSTLHIAMCLRVLRDALLQARGLWLEQCLHVLRLLHAPASKRAMVRASFILPGDLNKRKLSASQ